MSLDTYSFERVIPGACDGQHAIYQKMLAMYEWAKQFMVRKTVLEAGCGEGYGAAIMASVAKEIVAVDLPLMNSTNSWQTIS